MAGQLKSDWDPCHLKYVFISAASELSVQLKSDWDLQTIRSGLDFVIIMSELSVQLKSDWDGIFSSTSIKPICVRTVSTAEKRLRCVWVAHVFLHFHGDQKDLRAERRLRPRCPRKNITISVCSSEKTAKPKGDWDVYPKARHTCQSVASEMTAKPKGDWDIFVSSVLLLSPTKTSEMTAKPKGDWDLEPSGVNV
jgi:hypothetical protein